MAHYHLMGIGGIGVGKVAGLLAARGETVSGCDTSDNAMVGSLRELGVEVKIGHDPAHIDQADVVIYSSAISSDHPEIQAALKKGCRVMRRAEALADLMQGHTAITVAGSHGKTTTTAMLIHMLRGLGEDPATALGGIMSDGRYTESLGRGKYFVAEADESDGSFVVFHPQYAIITNIDQEHMDYYTDWSQICDAYQRYINTITRDGRLIVCGDDTRLMDLVEMQTVPYVTYGVSSQCHLCAADIEFENGLTGFRLIDNGCDKGRFQLNVLGQHNVCNALAAITMAKVLGFDSACAAKALKDFLGVRRRFQILTQDHMTVVDDYAHHPTEIQATLAAARIAHQGRLCVVFQPHRYSRLNALMDEFAQSFSLAETVIVTDIYAASEDPIDGVTAQALCKRIHEKSGQEAVYVSRKTLVQEVAQRVQAGDMIIFMGAGDITKAAADLAATGISV